MTKVTTEEVRSAIRLWEVSEEQFDDWFQRQRFEAIASVLTRIADSLSHDLSEIRRLAPEDVRKTIDIFLDAMRAGAAVARESA